MKQIPLTQGRFALVDDEDYELLKAFKWCVSAGYVMRRTPAVNGKRGCMVMSRQILGLAAGDPTEIDHDNGNKLDNQRRNLRPCTHTQNMGNTRLAKSNTSGFKGVTLRKTTGRWQAAIQVAGLSRHLGYYATPEEAHEVYCLAADLVFGEFSHHGA